LRANKWREGISRGLPGIRYGTEPRHINVGINVRVWNSARRGARSLSQQFQHTLRGQRQADFGHADRVGPRHWQCRPACSSHCIPPTPAAQRSTRGGNIPPKPSPTGGRPRRPFHEPPNVLVTPHCSSSCDATAERRWSAVTGNLDRFARGEALENVVLRT
jgi:hypothetical protein